MKIEHNGLEVPFEGVHHWPSSREVADTRQRERMDEKVREGVLTDDHGAPLPEKVARRVRSRLLGTYDHMPAPTTFGESRERNRGGGRWLIPGLWRWGTIPMLGGNPKAGKTTLVADLCAALTEPGRQFLGHFEPVTLTEEERDIWVINAETHPGDFEEALEEAGLHEGSQLIVDHLEERGSAASFDLTDPQRYDEWAHRLVYCESCDGSDEVPPTVVIVDGVTAILLASGKGTEAYGAWYAAFRRLMREIDCPNALVVAHNTLNGSHLMGGVEAQAGPDGLWSLSSSNSDDPAAPRYFSVNPRMGGAVVPRTRVRLSEGGRLQMGTQAEKAEPGVDPVQELTDRLVAYVREHPGVDGQALTNEVPASSKQASLGARDRAVERGLIRKEQCGEGRCQCEKPHHRRSHYWSVEG